MDIHRCRFVPYPPSTINALAFSHSHLSKDQKATSPRLAVGRANGDIEIWNPLNGSWLQESIIRGGQGRSVDGLVWIQDPNEEDINGRTIIGKSRLFSIGYTTTVTEWDLEKGRPLRQCSGNHSEIWCLAAQPALPLVKEANGASATEQLARQNLIAGCTDGALVLYSTAGDLQLQRVLVRPSSKKTKIISVFFQDRNFVVAGCTDSTIRIYDVRNGSMLRSMSLGSGPVGGPKEIIVWSVRSLPNGNIVSGDSTGEVRIWDGSTYTLMQRIKGHRQDVLSLATSSDGSTIFSGGMDRRTVVYKQVGKGISRWAEVGHRRYHCHDVKTMATFEGKGMSFVVSGGPDASPIVLPIRQFGMENQRALPFLPQDSIARGTLKNRLMSSWWDREVHIWRLNKLSKIPTDNDESETEVQAQSRKLVAKIMIKGEASITSTALSTDGSLLVVSTAADIKMFQLRSRKSGDGDGLRISKLQLPKAFTSGARLVEISPDGRWLCIVRDDSRVAVARIVSDGKNSVSSIRVLPVLSKLDRINRRIEKFTLLGGLGTYDRTVIRVAFSSDTRILAVSDLSGYIDTWVLKGHEDLDQDIDGVNDDASSTNSSEDDSDSDEDATPKLIFGQHWTRNPSASLIPKLPSAPVVLSFRPAIESSQKPQTNGVGIPRPTRNNPHPVSHDVPAGEERLIVVTATSKVFEFEVLHGSLSPWSRRNPTSNFPEEFQQLRDQAMGCLWDISENKERLWIYGVSWLWMFDLSRDFPTMPGSALTNGHVNGNGLTNGDSAGSGSQKKKRKRDTGAGGEIPDEQLGTGISREMQRIIHEEVNEMQRISRHPSDDRDMMDLDEDEEDGDIAALEPLRRGEDVAWEPRNGHANAVEEAPHWWYTYKYRPILGIVPIGESGGEVGPEVAIIERPIWEADLPSRYYGDQEWDQAGV